MYKAFQAKGDSIKSQIRKAKNLYLDSLDPSLNRTLPGNTYKKSKIIQKLKQDKIERKELIEKKGLLPLPEKDPGFKKFSRWWSFPMYKGLFKWQLESHNKLFDTKFSLELVHRKAGKSIKYATEYEYSMQYKGFDILLLGWTDRRKEIALYVYTFFNQHGLIERDQRTSPFHFKIKNGGKFDCYLISGKETLGMHAVGKQERFVDLTKEDRKELRELLDKYGEDGSFTDEEFESFIADRESSERKLWIAIDDPIDITFMKEHYREKELELRFDSTLYSIDPDKWSFTGTHKFEGDIFDFWMAKFGSELVTFISGPFREDGSLLCPELYTHPSQPNYKAELKKGKKCLDKIRRHIGEYSWHSEWCQNPHPITGEQWDHLAFVELINTPLDRKHDICFITIDRATTEKISSDYTGCFIGLREMKTGCRIITHDWTAKIPLEDLLIKVNDFLILFRAMHEHIQILLIVEKQGGGDEFISQARTRFGFTKPDPKDSLTLIHIPNRILEIAHLIELHNTGEKIQRIKNRLSAPINNERVKFMSTLQHSEGTKQVLYFPNNANFDAPDALANSEFVLGDYPLILGEDGRYIDQLTHMYQDIDKGILPFYNSELERGLNRIELKKVKKWSNRRVNPRRTLF